MTQKKTVQPQITHDHAGHAHVNCPGHAPCRLCRIEVDHLSVSAGNQQLLHDVNLHIHCGELTALIGANGAGKTTLIRALLGQVEYKGVIRHLTTDGRPAADVRTGYVPQQLEFDRSSPVTVTDFMAASLSKRPVFLGVSQKTREKVMAALARTHSERLCKRPLGALSGGELQRTFLAQVFAQNPKLLILDEPANHLDLIYQKHIFSLIEAWLKQPGRAVISVVHDLSLAKKYGTHAVLMDRGRCAAQGKTDEVMTRERLEAVYGMDVYGWMRDLLGQWS